MLVRSALVLALLVPPACGREHDGATAVTPPDTIAARVGERFSIRLDANPTTGYRWRLATPPDPQVVTPAGSDYAPEAAGLVGAGGEEVWTFVAHGRGRTRIVFEYARPWEHDTPPPRTHTVDVRVEAATPAPSP